MIYCMSDIHGEYDRYQAMLKLIDFSAEDTLYILGDVIDRKPSGIDILKDIIQRPNARMIIGNHEQIALDTLGVGYKYGARELWKQNGGNNTYREMVYLMTPQERTAILKFLYQLPDHLEIEVHGRLFYLVHGYPAEDHEQRIWARPKPGLPAPIPGVTAVIGHTPTVFLAGDDGTPFRIWHGDGIIDIDCGCGNQTEQRRLACLRLDDMAEFYV